MLMLAEAARQIMTLDGAVSCAVVDIEAGECLSRSGVAVTGALEAAALVNARMLRAKLRMVDEHYGESIEDILITLGRHYHVIRLIGVGDSETGDSYRQGSGGRGAPSMFFYLVLDKGAANLALARRRLASVERGMFQAPDAPATLEAARARASRNDGKFYGTIGGFGHGHEDELPPFMRDDVAMKLLGIDAGDETRGF